ncbi:hypothetical protein CMUS01_13229 [Colletotrichum musicola]|uniref:Uncharacterized protein n=1 Tax=Colletotrichum musicola TaxID=2175873 RepID=A0A8H6MWH7_9PEZI|nr:hypothetical protein CMUS01_13229 [Colletotrichum musicola]
MCARLGTTTKLDQATREGRESNYECMFSCFVGKVIAGRDVVITAEHMAADYRSEDTVADGVLGYKPPKKIRRTAIRPGDNGGKSINAGRNRCRIPAF